MIPRVVETPSELRRHAGRIKRGYDAFAGTAHHCGWPDAGFFSTWKPFADGAIFACITG